jgi:hypothetical protein
MANQTLQYLATQWSFAQQNFIDDVLKTSGILRTASVGFANNGLFHKYNKVISLPTATIRSINGSVVPYTTEFDLLQLDLKEIMTTEQVDATLAAADPGGVAGYLNKVKAGHMEALSQAAEKSLVYGTNATYGATDGFKGFHGLAYAAETARSLSVIDAGGTSNTTSIFAVTWKPEVCQIIIPAGIANGADFIQMTPLHGGEKDLVTTSTTTGARKPVYEVMYQMLMALQAGSNYSIHRIVGVDAGTNAPTVAEMDTLIDLVRGDSANTVIYTSRLGRRALQTLKGTKFFSQAVGDQNMNTILEYWNGIPIVVSENILESETKSTISAG